jgi:hypothetical protein
MTVKKHSDHPIVDDLRNFRGYADDVSVDKIYETESARLALMPPEKRAIELREFSNRANAYEANLRQKAQQHRFETHLKNMHERLRRAGR